MSEDNNLVHTMNHMDDRFMIEIQTPKRIPAHSMKQNQPLKSSLLKNKFEPELQFVLSFENYIQCTSNLIFLNTFE